MPDIKDFLEAEQFALDFIAKKTEDLTYEQVCENLKFYCGFNPKTEENIANKISSGLPQLTNVKVKVRGAIGQYIKITFCMPDGASKKYEYK